MKAPRASHDLLCGVNTTRKKRALCSRSHTSSTVVSAVNRNATVDERHIAPAIRVKRPSSMAMAGIASAPEPIDFVQQ